MQKNDIKLISDEEHVLLRTGRYLGSTKHVKNKLFLANESTGKFEYKEVEYVPAFEKIIRELIDNSTDEGCRTNFKYANIIKVDIDKDGYICISDNGRGIPVKKIEGSDLYAPEAAFTKLRAGANFNDESDNTTIGQNGEGAALVNILSKEFCVDTSDGNKRFQLTCKDNLSSKKFKISDSSKKYTEVIFLPDYERFSLKNIDDIHMNIIKSNLINLAITYPEITFYFNKEKVNSKSFKKYMELFSDNFESLESDNLNIGVFANNSDDFNFLHYINGINVYEGGNPLSWVVDSICDLLREKIGKKYKDIKRGDIKNKLSFVVFFKNMSNPRFDNQVKSKCINTYADFKDKLGDIDLDKIANKIFKNEKINDVIIESYKIKEEFKKRQELKNISKTSKNFRCDKYLPPIKENKYLAICEGLSAVSGLSSALGRKEIGYFELKGVPLNTYEVNSQKLSSNEEMCKIIQVLGLQLGIQRSYDINFKYILLATDSDLDGTKIAALMTGFFNKYAKHLVLENRIKRLRTPVIILKKNNKIDKFFFDFNEYNEFIKTNNISKYELKYMKGLGSWSKSDLEYLVEKYGLEYFIETLTFDDKTDIAINNWLSKDTSDIRKDMLKKNNFSIFSI